MENIEFSVEQKNLITIGDIFVDVDVRFVDRANLPRSRDEQMTVDKLNSNLAILSHEIKQMVKDKLGEAFNPTQP